MIRLGRPHLIIDLEPVEFFDSSGLTTVIGILRSGKGRQGSRSLAAAPPHLARLLG
ncbi:STAS domain-containing protein [Streptomyces sp. NPDC002911]